MESFARDLRFGVRTLAKSRTFTLVAVAVLALGIGANAAIFSVVNGVLLHALPYDRPDSVVTVWDNFENPKIPHTPISVPEYFDYAANLRSFAGMGAYAETTFNVSGEGESAELIQAGAATASLFPTLGLRPLVGRTFTEAEDSPGNDRVVVLAYDLWQSRFSGDPGVVGRKLVLDEEQYEIIGVMPKELDVASSVPLSAWVPVAFTPQQREDTARGSRFLTVVGRLAPGVTIGAARAELDTFASAMTAAHADKYHGLSGFHVTMSRLEDEIVGGVRPALLVLLGAVGLILLIACANVANLLLARASARHREIAIRTALGASRWRLARQFVAESLVLSVTGGALGVALAAWGVDIIVATAGDTIPRSASIGVDARVLGFAFLLSLVTGVAFGVAPALGRASDDLAEGLKDGGRGATEGARGRRVRAALVVTEVALALVLLVGSGLLLRSFARLWTVDPGFDSARVLTTQITLPPVSYPTDAEVIGRFRDITEKAAALPGVRSAAVTSLPPMVGGSSGTVNVDGYVMSEGETNPEADFRIVGPDFFKTMGVAVLEGRAFGPGDAEGAPLAAVVDDTLARKYFPNGNAVGGRIKRGGPSSKNPWLTVVGVVHHVRNQSLDDEGRVQIYFPALQSQFSSPIRSMYLLAKTDGDPRALAGSVRAMVAATDPNLPVADVRTMDDVLAQSVATRRLAAYLLGGFAAVALVLAALGLFGVLAYTVSQRTHEIGVRMALGARPADVLRLVVGHGLGLALAGIGIGLAASFALSRVLASLLFEVSPTDAPTYAGTAALLAVVAVVASAVPAWRALRVDPMVALRHD